MPGKVGAVSLKLINASSSLTNVLSAIICTAYHVSLAIAPVSNPFAPLAVVSIDIVVIEFILLESVESLQAPTSTLSVVAVSHVTFNSSIQFNGYTVGGADHDKIPVPEVVKT